MMIHQVTRGIKISVETNFEGVFCTQRKLQYAFRYFITIANQSNDSVQLKSRFWKIKDALNKTEIVEGEGVIGVKPVLKPGETYSYKSGCILTSPLGSMDGHFNMVNLTSTKKFSVKIPSFKLCATFALN